MATMLVGGVLSTGVSAAQHCCHVASAGLTSNVKQILVCICMYSYSALTDFLFVCFLFPVSCFLFRLYVSVSKLV